MKNTVECHSEEIIDKTDDCHIHLHCQKEKTQCQFEIDFSLRTKVYEFGKHVKFSKLRIYPLLH